MEEVEITFDHSYIYVNQEKFFPIIQEQVGDFDPSDSANALLISVKCFDDDIDWDTCYYQAEQAVLKGKWILWELDIKTGNFPMFIQDSALFFSLGLSIEEFLRRLWKPFKEKSLGVSLFRGSTHFTENFLWTEQHEIHYQERILECPLLPKHLLRQMFGADVFVEYLHRLASFLPDSLLVFCLIDVSFVKSTAELAFLLSKERFQHILLGLKKCRAPLGHLNWEEGACLGGWVGRGAPYFSSVPEIKTAVCLPLEDKISPEVLSALDAVFLELGRFDVSFRVIDESHLNECWDGIDDLLVLTSSLSSQGLRKLHGFLAAGGRVVSIGALLGLENEISLESFTKNLSEAEVFF